MDDRLAAIEAYYDAVPRNAARVEQLGPFTLFVNPGPGWSYYARPTLGATGFAVEHVLQVRERQRALGVPEALEWVAETTPALRLAAVEAGMKVLEHPMMVLDPDRRRHPPAPAQAAVRLVTLEDDLALLGAVAALAFASPGTAVGREGVPEMVAVAARRGTADATFERQRLRAGWTIMAAAYVDNYPVAVGSHQPVGLVTEVVGVATLPAYRRRGLATAVTCLLVEDALERGVETVFLSADDDAVAQMYERVGFRRIATACVAEVG